MELVKKSEQWSIWKKRSGRHAVKDANGAYLKGEEKLKVLLAEGVVKPQVAKKKAEGEKA